MNKKTLQSYQLMQGDPYLRYYNSDSNWRFIPDPRYLLPLKQFLKRFILADWQRVISNYVSKYIKE